MTKRIAFVLPDMGGGGAERVTQTLIEEFLERGHDVDLVLMRAEGALMPLVPEAVRVVDLKAKRIRSAFWPLVRYLRERKPDAVQASLWPLTIITILASMLARTGARVVTSDHAILSKQYGRSRAASAALKATTRWLYPKADARICVSDGSAVDLARLSGLPTNCFTVVHNPVLPPGKLATNQRVEELWGSDGHRILTVGGLHAVKNQVLLIRAFASLANDSKAKLMIVGEGALRPRLEQVANELAVADRVILPGFAADPWPYYASADLFVLSSDHEGFGNVLVEAMLAGLPVVSTDCPGGPREILDGGRYGRLLPAGNSAALAKAMAAALEEPHDPEPGRQHAKRISGASFERYLDLMLRRAD